MSEKFTSVEAYLDSIPPQSRPALDELRRVVHETVPGAEEAIGYQILAIRRDGHALLYLAGWREHVSMYPVPAGDPELERDVAPYVAGKDTVKLPLSQPLPLDLVRRIAGALAGSGLMAGFVMRRLRKRKDEKARSQEVVVKVVVDDERPSRV